jgi:hypothetical protein
MRQNRAIRRPEAFPANVKSELVIPPFRRSAVPPDQREASQTRAEQGQLPPSFLVMLAIGREEPT